MGDVVDIAGARRRRARAINRRAVDGWTAVHVASGAIAALYGTSRPLAYGAAAAYEVLEQAFESRPTGQRWFGGDGPESGRNVLADMAAFAVGYELARRGRSVG